MYATNLAPANPYNKKCERRLEARKLAYINTDKTTFMQIFIKFS